MEDKIHVTPPGSFARGFAVVPHATNPIVRPSRAILVGGAGTVVCKLLGETADITITAVAGQLLPICASHVRATSTATGMIALTE